MGEALREHNAGRAPDAGRGRVGIALTRALAVAAMAALAACLRRAALSG